MLHRSLAAVLIAAVGAQDDPRDPERGVVESHAAHCRAIHRDCSERAERLRGAVRDLLAAPDEPRLRAARTAWIAARAAYGEIEALRFRGDPIESIEPLLNAWPVDESYIDAVVGGRDVGIVNDRTKWPVLTSTTLIVANERGGETNVSVGWHAIEFLLWGQDQDPNGPGNRPFTDFVAGDAAADRRRAYLGIVVDLLVEQLASLRDAWAPGAPHRTKFEADPHGSLRAMLTGAVVLTAFEMCGERLAVAYETRDQEQEHSCFSDTTCQDLVANQRGVMAVLRGPVAPTATTPTIVTLLRAKDTAAAANLEAALEATLTALQAIPAPFDRAFLGPDDAPGRRAIRAAMDALDRQTEAITIAGRVLGHDLPLRPGN